MFHGFNSRHQRGHAIAGAVLVAALSVTASVCAEPSQTEINLLKQKLKEEGIRLNALTRSLAIQPAPPGLRAEETGFIDN